MYFWRAKVIHFLIFPKLKAEKLLFFLFLLKRIITDMESPFTHNTIASGNDFLSRKREVSQTVLNIRNRINTVIYEPPKTGKDSLVHMAISQCPGLSTAYIDLLSIVDNGDLSHRLQAADGHTLIYIKNFQSILRLDDWSKAVHAISRQMLRDDAPVYIITGSGINAMKHIFEDHKLMYRQYERVRFSAIDERSVTEHIVRTFLKVGRVVSQEQAEYIYNIADGHPWYIWQIADYCFNITKGYLSGNAVTEAVDTLLYTHSVRFQETVDNLSRYQIYFLKAVFDGISKSSSSEVIERYRLNSSANVFRVKEALAKKEVITVDAPDTPRIIDPMFRLWLARNYFNEQQ